MICDITISLLIKFNGEANSQTKLAIQTTSTAGIVIMAFGLEVPLIWGGEVIPGLISIDVHIIRYFVFRSAYIRYISKQIRYRRNPKQNKFRD